MLHHVALLRTDVSDEPSASLLEVTKIGELSDLVFLRAYRSF
jgi:hypothetical protein